MNKEYLMDFIYKKRITAIVRGLESSCLKDLADAFYEGGIELMEVPFNQKDPDSFKTTASTIASLVEHTNGRMHIGAGTVLTTEQVDQVFYAGGEIIVTPNTNPSVIERAKRYDMVTMIGALTPTEVEHAYTLGADFVKIFPAGNLGAAYVKAIRAPLGHIPMIAVGGVNEKNLKDFYDAGCCGAAIGGNLCNMEWIQHHEFHKITELARTFIRIQ